MAERKVLNVSSQFKTTSTRIRFHAKTETFLFVFAFRPHANAFESLFESLRFHRKWRLSKTSLKVETFESGDFRKRCVVVWTGENGDF